jgi:DNA-directed RNA polymerase subunit K/omega
MKTSAYSVRNRIKIKIDMTKKIPTNTLTRDLNELAAPTGNIYETVTILSKRANQIAIAEKKELTKKLEDFKNSSDTLEEFHENREQIEISKYYERQPKPSLVSISEFQNDEIYYRMAKKEGIL